MSSEKCAIPSGAVFSTPAQTIPSVMHEKKLVVMHGRMTYYSFMGCRSLQGRVRFENANDAFHEGNEVWKLVTIA